MTPEEIIACLARMTSPHKSFDRDDSADTLARLIGEARATLSPDRRRREARLYHREKRGFSRAMLLIRDAPADELRSFAMFVVDLLWGEGLARSRREARRLDPDKEWDCPAFLGEIAEAISYRSFYPFPKAE